jgi:carbamoyl-phosphate synthase large subunit
MPDHPTRIALLSPGAKVGLTRAFVDAAQEANCAVMAWENDPWSPAATLCALRFGGGAIETDADAEYLLAQCLEHAVALVVPTRHDDLPTLAAHRDRFAEAGVAIAVSSPDSVRICCDKLELATWLLARRFPTPPLFASRAAAAAALAGGATLVAKHRRGSGSSRVRFVRTATELANVPEEWILQPLAAGREWTVHVHVDRSGRSVCEIPHERLLVSDGEVLRARTGRLAHVMALAREIAEHLPAARGPLNIQMFVDATGGLLVTDVNPRFGGGYPLAHRAGGRSTAWLLAEYLFGHTLARCDDWESGLLMVRYREATFHSEG